MMSVNLDLFLEFSKSSVIIFSGGWRLTACFPLVPLLGFSAECAMHYEPSSRTLTVAGAAAAHPGPGESQVGAFTLTDPVFASCLPSLYSSTLSSFPSSLVSPWLLKFNNSHATPSRVTNIKRYTPSSISSSLALRDGQCSYLFESTLGSSQSASLRMIEDDEKTNLQQVVFEHKFADSIWDFDCNPLFFSGTETVCLAASKRAYLLHVPSKKVNRISTEGSDVLTQHFVDSNMIACGCRDGRVRYFDLRADMRTGKLTSLVTPSSVCWMQSISEGLQVVVSCVNGSLLCLDRRFSGTLVTFETHVNSYSHLRGYVNSLETQLFMGGEDGMIRAWDLTDGELLLTSSALKAAGAALGISSVVPVNINMVDETLLLGTSKGVFGLTFSS